MPLVDPIRRELHLKLVYYGPGLSGKTANLEFIHKRSRPDSRGKLVSLKTESERTLFFDLLPVTLGEYHGYGVRIHLSTVPGQIAYDSTRRMILKHVDGVVFVVDSQATRLEDNIESYHNLTQNLRMQADDPDRIPLVVQYNKRDLPGVLGVSELQRALRIPNQVPQFEGVATQGIGVFDTFKAITKETLRALGHPDRLPPGRSRTIGPKRDEALFSAKIEV